MNGPLEDDLRSAIAALWAALFEKCTAAERRAIIHELFGLILVRSCFDQPDTQQFELREVVAAHAARAFALVASLEDDSASCPALALARLELGALIETAHAAALV